MLSEVELKKREIEAKATIQQWVDTANTCGWNENGIFDKKRFGEALDVIEDMLIIYNIFAEKQIVLTNINNNHIYKLTSL